MAESLYFCDFFSAESPLTLAPHTPGAFSVLRSWFKFPFLRKAFSHLLSILATLCHMSLFNTYLYFIDVETIE